MADTVPLDLRTISKESISKEGQVGKKKETFPALHEAWKEEVLFVTYRSPLFLSDPAAIDEWLEEAACLEEDLVWLLRLTHHRFWSQIVYDETLQATVDSFLQTCPRLSDDYSRLPEAVRSKQLRLNELFFRVVIRMGTCKESSEFHITPVAFGNMLYNTYLMDIPKMMDLCAVFGSGNESILSKMIASVFRHQPKYDADLQVAASCIREALESVMQRCTASCGDDGPVPLLLRPAAASCQHGAGAAAASGPMADSLSSLSAAALEDLLLYAFDVSFTLRAFLDAYPAGSVPFHESDFYSTLAVFHDEAADALTRELRRRKLQTYRFYTAAELRTRLGMMRSHLLAVFRCLLSHNCLLPLMDRRPEADEASLIDSYLGILSAAVSEKKFLLHYNRSFPLEDDLDLFSQMGFKLDAARVTYIRSGLIPPESGRHPTKHKRKEPQAHSTAAAAADVWRGSTEQKVINTSAMLNGSVLGHSVSDVELASIVSSVRDLLPDLGDGFVEACLREFKYNAEHVVNAVLENSLPSSLKSLDRSMPRKREPTTGSILESRRNVHDNDEFDVFSQAHIDQNRVHKGKKSVSIPIQDSELKDKIKALATEYQELGLASESTPNDFVGLYDDEYDDTYDNEVGADDVDSADELMGRPVVLPRILAGPPQGTESRASSSDEEEAKAAAGMAAAGAWAQQGSSQQQQRQSYDVKGRARGQGQSSEVLHNRAFKERHKGRGANHNRKAMSDRKRQRGMFA